MKLAHPAVAVAGLFLMVGTAVSASAETSAPSTAAQLGPPSTLIQPDFQSGLRQAGDGKGGAPTTKYCERHLKIACYQARQIEQAYNLPVLYAKHWTGTGQTIVVINPYGSPTVAHDLAVFDHAERLPAPSSLKIIQPAGKVAPYKPTFTRQGWAQGTDLSVEIAHAIAPGAGILVVNTPTNENEGRSGFPQIVKAEEYVVNNHLGSVISQDFATPEQDFATAQEILRLRGAYIDAAKSGVTVLDSTALSGVAGLRYSGDTYYLHRVISWPDSDPLVTAVGGTQLHLNAAGHQVRAASVFNDSYSVPVNKLFGVGKGPSALASGGGRSIIFARPRYQNGVAKVARSERGTPDISMSGACNGTFMDYQSFRGLPTGWYPVCGPAVSAPEFAGIVALAGQMAGHPIGLINPYLYELSAHHAPGIVNVTRGNNTVRFHQHGKWHTIKGFNAKRGYNLATGVGTINARYFVPELACLATHKHWTWALIAATPSCRLN